MNEDELDDILGRGAGDGDAYGYPGQKPDNIKYIGQDKAVVQYQFEPRNRREGYPFLDIDYDPRTDEDWSIFNE